jgi:phosphatidylglycerol---prolipoprotein diacylglyceryl transferase
MQALNIDPVLISLGPIQVRWYGLMYVIGFVITAQLLKVLVRDGIFNIKRERIDPFVSYMIIGMFLGARLTYVFVYNWEYYSQHFDQILAVWRGGLSFHGAIIGFALAGWFFARREKIPTLQAYDVAVTAGCQGVFFGRLGNFINGELYGRVTDSQIGMIFSQGGPYPRHPSQLYEAVFEGLVLFLILWLVRKRVKFYGVLTAIFLMGYAFMRYFIEFFRQPDVQLGYYFGGTTSMGQILCIIMLLFGVGFLLYSRKLQQPIIYQR